MDYFISFFSVLSRIHNFTTCNMTKKSRGACIREGEFIRVNTVSATTQAQGHMHPVLKNKALKALGFCFASSILNSFAQGRAPNLNGLLV